MIYANIYDNQNTYENRYNSGNVGLTYMVSGFKEKRTSREDAVAPTDGDLPVHSPGVEHLPGWMKDLCMSAVPELGIRHEANGLHICLASGVRLGPLPHVQITHHAGGLQLCLSPNTCHVGSPCSAGYVQIM